MTLSLIFLTLAALFILLKKNEDRIRAITGWQKKTEERISSFEDREFRREAQLDRHTSYLKRIRKDVNALGRDVGWDDNLHKTQTIEKKEPDKPDDGTS